MDYFIAGSYNKNKKHIKGLHFYTVHIIM